MTAPESPRRRRQPEMTLMRPLPGHTAVHRLWAGTKLVGVVVMALMLFLKPTWSSIAAGAVLVAVAWVVARIPRGSLPRPPRWFWIGFALGAFLTLRSSKHPVGHLLGVHVSWGGLEEWARITALALVVLVAAAVMTWTTDLAEVAPALASLGRPLRWVRLPVDEWAASIALAIRCLPLLIEEVRTLAAARRLRPTGRLEREPRWNWILRDSQDLLFTSLAVSLRRATELGDAMEARGGFGAISASRTRPGWRDAAAGVLLAAGFAAALLL
ncbi:MAG TPA: energy-coupling factor transporter transmembrane protein EcfT [Acidimicrobiales bacterium]|jgi:energy-coupling factor transport system permease protein|nr:energy-coupling factor transporter transmembrane protein EcfT [Acidimicrobiales bacterium]